MNLLCVRTAVVGGASRSWKQSRESVNSQRWISHYYQSGKPHEHLKMGNGGIILSSNCNASQTSSILDPRLFLRTSPTHSRYVTCVIKRHFIYIYIYNLQVVHMMIHIQVDVDPSSLFSWNVTGSNYSGTWIIN